MRRHHANQSMLLFMVTILAMANLVIWSELYGRFTAPTKSAVESVRQYQSNYRPNPVWI